MLEKITVDYTQLIFFNEFCGAVDYENRSIR